MNTTVSARSPARIEKIVVVARAVKRGSPSTDAAMESSMRLGAWATVH
jgi:hypothetical protein